MKSDQSGGFWRVGNSQTAPLALIDHSPTEQNRILCLFSSIRSSGSCHLVVYCDMNTDDGGWTVIRRRIDGTENFYRPWSHYKAGFGKAAGEYWLGEFVSLFTEAEFDLVAFAHYSSFSIDPENNRYQLHLGELHGWEWSLAGHNNMKFTTFDNNQDKWDKNCAHYYLGGFWYGACHMVNPNGMHAPHGAVRFEKVYDFWQTWKGWNHSLKAISMKIRSANNCSCTHQSD
uniref:Fibrinogen C-terminal domain-containing protein n=1 Tax=Takifugu rubripes TaxID=31033 RepID=H2UFM9_TAKRU